ncbi:MAG TPA: OmpA family protein [Cyclobacteriaceae bacterium]|nr:OmpA family protein [Cyclobacteriaceae bacterium]
MEQAQLMMDAGSIALEEIRDVMIQAAEFDTTSVKANFEAGHLFLETINQDQAVKYFMRVYRQQPGYKYDLEYWIGKSYQYGKNFDKAIEYYTKYKNKAAKATGEQMTAAENDRRIEECKNGKEFMAAPQNFSIVNVGKEINSEYDDYGPVLNEDETQLVFTTRRRDGNMNENVFSDNKPWEDIFISSKNGQKWNAAKNIGAPVTTQTHESTLASSRDGNTLLIYKDDGNGDIFETRRNPDGTWSAPEPLESINSTYAEASASLSADGSTLYFASDRPGGLGGLDIYMATKDRRGQWTGIKNLGAGINSTYDEEAPFIDYEGKVLYFSSRGRKGMGGYDIFKATLTDPKQNKWSEPENLGYPVNTPGDDVFFVITKDGKRGYYSSTREDGLGYSDIYRVDPGASKNEKIPSKLAVKVFDAATKQAMDAKVSLISVKDKSVVPMTSTRAGVYDFTVTAEEAKDYTLLVEKEGYASQSTVMNIAAPSEKANNLTQTFELAKATEKPAEPVTPTVTKKEPQPVKFSVKVVDAATRQPLDAKVSLTSVKDNKAIPVTGSYEFLIAEPKDYRLSVEKQGYIFQNTVVSIGTSPVTRTVELKKPTVGVTQILHNIYFDTDKATFKKESYDELSKLENMMKQNANLKLEIAGHTDSFGPDAYNKKLSMARASAVRAFLTSRGIDTKRVTAAGYGDTRPLASNDDEEGGREINRRVEFKIISN